MNKLYCAHTWHYTLSLRGFLNSKSKYLISQMARGFTSYWLSFLGDKKDLASSSKVSGVMYGT